MSDNGDDFFAGLDVKAKALALSSAHVIALADIDLDKGLGYIRLSNEFVASRHSLTLVEQRVLSMAIARRSFNDRIPRVVAVDAAAYAAEYGITSSVAYRELKEAAKGLFDKSVQINFDGNAAQFSEYRLFDEWTLYENGSIRLHFSDRFLQELNQQFSSFYVSYKQKFTRGLMTENAHRLYQLLMVKYHRKLKKGTAVFDDIELLKRRLCMDGKYPLYGNFKKRVIVPALNNINSCSELSILSFSEIKKGKKVTGFAVDFEENRQASLSL